MTTIVDLSQDIYETMMVFPGHCKTVQFQHAWHWETEPKFDDDPAGERFSFQTTGLMLNDNGPTHVDSFSHLDPDPTAPTIDQMSLELFFGSGICLDVSHVAEREDISVADCEAALEKSGQELNEGDVLLFHTAHWNRHAGTVEYLDQHAGLGAEAAEWVASKKPKVFGVDSPTPDNPSSTVFPVHLMSRNHRITHYENLANLDQLLGKRFEFYGFPLKIVGGHGGPTRAVALLEDA